MAQPLLTIPSMRKETAILNLDSNIQSLINFAFDDVTDNKRIGEHDEASALKRITIVRIKLLREGYDVQAVNLVSEVLSTIYFG